MSVRKRLIVKLGSSSITRATGPNPALLAATLDSAVRAKEYGWDVGIVSSGAVSTGLAVLNRPAVLDREPSTTAAYSGPRSRLRLSRHLAAAVGQPILLGMYRYSGDMSGTPVAQVLIGDNDLRSPSQVKRINDLVSESFDRGIVPILNGNDAIDSSTSDNDSVAASVAVMIGADLLLLLTDVDGVYLDDVGSGNYLREILPPDIHRIDVLSSGSGTGGIRSKLRAAELAAFNGIESRIASAKEDDVIMRCLQGTGAPGTRIPPADTSRTPGKRRELVVVSRGSLVVNLDAERSIARGSSLFASGVKKVAGSFQPGDVVEVIDPDGRLIARGVTELSSQLLWLIRALRRDEIAAVLVEILGRFGGAVARADVIAADGRPTRPHLAKALTAVQRLSHKNIQTLGPEVLALFGSVAAQILVENRLENDEKLGLLAKRIDEFAAIENRRLKIILMPDGGHPDGV